MSDGLTLAELHVIIERGRAQWADPRFRRRALAAAIERETCKLAYLRDLGLSTAGLEQRIDRIRSDYRATVLDLRRRAP